MSALPPKADIGTQPLDVRFVPKADIGRSLFDHLVGGGDQRLWDHQTKRLRGLEIDHKLELGWLFDW